MRNVIKNIKRRFGKEESSSNSGGSNNNTNSISNTNNTYNDTQSQSQLQSENLNSFTETSSMNLKNKTPSNVQAFSNSSQTNKEYFTAKSTCSSYTHNQQIRRNVCQNIKNAVQYSNSTFSKQEYTKNDILNSFPTFKECITAEKESLFIKKLKFCCFSFDVNDQSSDNRTGLEIKRKLLLELTEYIQTSKKQFTPRVISACIDMISRNLFRSLPPPSLFSSNMPSFNTSQTSNSSLVGGFFNAGTPGNLSLNSNLILNQNNTFENADEEQMIEYSDQEQLSLVYDFFFRLISITSNSSLSNESSNNNKSKNKNNTSANSISESKIFLRLIDQKQIEQILNLFSSDDYRERNSVKMILHRIYGSFMSLRWFIRKSISDRLLSLVYEADNNFNTENSNDQLNQQKLHFYNGVNDILEILASIIHGFMLPLKSEHKIFLLRVLIPLHKTRHFHLFHLSLSSAILQYLKKDCELAPSIIAGLLKFQPLTNSRKEALFLIEIEEILDLLFVSNMITNLKGFVSSGQPCREASNSEQKRVVFSRVNDTNEKNRVRASTTGKTQASKTSKSRQDRIREKTIRSGSGVRKNSKSKSSSSKKSEDESKDVEKFVDSTFARQFRLIIEPLFRRLALCLCSSNLTISERTLCMQANESLLSIVSLFGSIIIPIIYPSLKRNTLNYTNSTIYSMTSNIKKEMANLCPEPQQQCLQHDKNTVTSPNSISAFSPSVKLYNENQNVVKLKDGFDKLEKLMKERKRIF